MKIKDFDQKAQKALLTCFQDIPFVDGPENITKAHKYLVDYVFRVINLNTETPTTLLVEAKNSGQPRFTKEAVNQLLVSQNKLDNSYGLFLAPYISPRSAKICKENNLGYVDLAGNCFLSFSSIFVEKEGNPNPYTQYRELKSLFYPKSERVLRVLLTAGPKEWLTADLAEEAGVSLGLVSNVKKYLANQEWLEAETVGFRLTKPLELLETWAKNYSYQQNEISEYYSLENIGEVEAQLANTCLEMDIRCGLTGFSGGSRYAPAVRYQRATAYVEKDFDLLASALNLKQVSSGANVILFKPYDEGVFYGTRKIEGVPVVSPIQAYLDLKSFPGRGEEAAQALFDQVIYQLW